jgi:hypothetical protein
MIDEIKSSSFTTPPDYPNNQILDSFTFYPDNTTHDQRKSAYIDWCLKNPSSAGTKTPFLEIARLSREIAPNQKILQEALEIINQRPDCADFGMQVVLWLLYKFSDSPLVAPQLIAYANKVVLDFKYWPEEPGQDNMCTWTENHQILFTTAAYLFGQMFPEEIFTNSGQTGKVKMERSRSRIMRWLELRFQTGFSEWFSNVYYAEDLPALLSLIEFSQDQTMVIRAKMVVDLILLDIAANSFHGIFASSHGRSYVNNKITSSHESTSPISKMCFGMGHFHESLCAVPFALSQNYSLPPVIEAIGNHLDEPEFLNQQRCGILLAEAESLGLNFDNFEDAMRFLSLEAYLHPKTAAINLKMFDAYNWWENSFLKPMKSFRGLLNGMSKSGSLPFLLRTFEWDVCRNTREAVDVLTYRTPHYMLSSAQEYRVGHGGDQQSIWQAIIGEDATVFTTHPGGAKNSTPDDWTGSGILPHVRQVKNVLLCIYNLHHKPALYQKTIHAYTHAWFPCDKFDEVVEKNSWYFARKGNGFLALHSSQPTQWMDNNEILADGRKNAWVIELGALVEYDSFQDFINQISQSEIRFKNLTVAYHSPTQGKLSLKYKGALSQNGRCLKHERYPRYRNAYISSNYPAEEIKITKNEHLLQINLFADLREIR